MRRYGSRLESTVLRKRQPFGHWKVGGMGPRLAKKSPTRDPAAFESRFEEDVANTISHWKEYAHPRAREFFPTEVMLDDVLSQLAKG